MPESIETIVIGGGQAGLAMSYHLTRVGRPHVVLERGRVAERWRSERWDSLAFQFPNWMLRLPGHPYSGNAPDDFMGRDGIARFIADYAMKIAAPIRCGVAVTSVRPTDQGRFLVQAGQHTMETANVVIATGPYQLPFVPPYSGSFPPSIHQSRRTATRGQLTFRLVVCSLSGRGARGVKSSRIFEREDETYSTPFAGIGRWPRRYRGRDVGWWIEESGMTDITRDRMPPEWRGLNAPLMTGVWGGHTIDLREMANDGVTLLVGSLLDVSDGRLRISGDLNASLKLGDNSFSAICSKRRRLHQGSRIISQRRRVSTPIYAELQKHCLKSICSTCAIRRLRP